MAEPQNKKYLITLNIIMENCSSEEQVKRLLTEQLSIMIEQGDLSIFDIAEVSKDVLN